MSDFWTRRKSAVDAEARAEARAEQARIEAVERAKAETALEAMSDEDALAELGLPDPESLEIGDDFRRFLTDTVPAHLKRRALRRLWRTNPVLANLDGLNDYDDDYRAVTSGPVRTVYEVGRGIVSRIETVAADAESDQSEAPDANPAAPQDGPAIEPAAAPAGSGPVSADAGNDGAPLSHAPTRRRMQFSFACEGTT